MPKGRSEMNFRPREGRHHASLDACHRRFARRVKPRQRLPIPDEFRVGKKVLPKPNAVVTRGDVTIDSDRFSVPWVIQDLERRAAVGWRSIARAGLSKARWSLWPMPPPTTRSSSTASSARASGTRLGHAITEPRRCRLAAISTAPLPTTTKPSPSIPVVPRLILPVGLPGTARKITTRRLPITAKPSVSIRLIRG